MNATAMALDWPDLQDHVHFVETLAWTLRRERSLPAHVPLEDLVAQGMVGLVEARRRFNPECGTSFVTFAWIRVRGSILDYIRKECHQPRWKHGLDEDDYPDSTACIAEPSMELHRVLQQAEHLPAALKGVFDALVTTGGRPEDCTALLGISRSRFSSMRSQMRKQLRACVA
jgi:RNA polymerase sigma factor (sigma-70 family)